MKVDVAWSLGRFGEYTFVCNSCRAVLKKKWTAFGGAVKWLEHPSGNCSFAGTRWVPEYPTISMELKQTEKP